jgi:hypothetical protein
MSVGKSAISFQSSAVSRLLPADGVRNLFRRGCIGGFKTTPFVVIVNCGGGINSAEFRAGGLKATPLAVIVSFMGGGIHPARR